jgi:NAD(P)-dependent dehydrogenase (short-subunit alcohol dehydrogenase family)
LHQSQVLTARPQAARGKRAAQLYLGKTQGAPKLIAIKLIAIGDYVVGAVAMMKAVLPYMRQRRRGRILNITSMGGRITLPGISYYCGSKFALEGISEVVGMEVEPFGIAVTAVAPGSFRTDWAGRSMIRTPRSIADYDGLFDPIREAREQKSGKQLGDPAKAARAMLNLIDGDSPPAHLLLGTDALNLVRQKLSDLTAEINQWEAITRSTDG